MNTPSNLKQRGLKLALVSAFALGATMSSFSFAADNADVTATATVIAPIQIDPGVAPNFGAFSPNTGGTVLLDTSGATTVTGAVAKSTSAATAAGTVLITASNGVGYGITYTFPANLSTGGATPVTMAFSDGVGSFSTGIAPGTASDATGTGTGAQQTLYLGGTLTVASAQAAGTYSGIINVAVEYN